MPGPTVSARVRSRRTTIRRPRPPCRSRRTGRDWSSGVKPAPRSTSSTRCSDHDRGHGDSHLVAARQLPVPPPQLEGHRLGWSEAARVALLVPVRHSGGDCGPAGGACRPASGRSRRPCAAGTSSTSGWGRIRKRSSAIASATMSATSSGSSTSPAARTTLLGPARQAVGRRVQHARVHAHRAQAADPQAAVAVGHRQPLGERHRRVLGDRVRRRADLGEQAGGRGGRAEVALAAASQPGSRCRAAQRWA